jgi:hypothetical protein
MRDAFQRPGGEGISTCVKTHTKGNEGNWVELIPCFPEQETGYGQQQFTRTIRR